MFKHSKGQNFFTMITNIFMYVTVFYSIERLSSFIFFINLAISIFESFSWSTVQTAITYQVITTLDITFITKDYPQFLVGGILLIILLIILSSISFSSFKITLNHNRVLPQLLSIPFIYIYLQNIFDNFKKETILKSGINILYDKIQSILVSKPKVILKPGKLKNIIMIQIESFEVSAINKYATPFLYNLTQKYLYMPMDVVSYTSWSSSGVLITQCGIPQIIQDISWSKRRSDNISMYSKMTCLPDYLQLMGFKSYFYGMSYSDCQGFRTFMLNKNYSENIIAKNDKKLYEYIANKFIPERSSKPNELFQAWVANEDTHFPYSPRKWCKPENIGAPNFIKAHNCFDQAIRGLVNSYLNSSLRDNTVLILYPDHIMMATWVPKPRKVFMLFPGMKKRKFRNNLTYYDFAHTVLDLAGIKSVFPGFLYGNTAFSPQKPKYPDISELFVMYHSFNQLLNVKNLEIFMCNGKKQNKPCEDFIL